jgi:hypothetical protein
MAKPPSAHRKEKKTLAEYKRAAHPIINLREIVNRR